MAPTAPANHDPALSHPTVPGQTPQASQPPTGIAPSISDGGLPNVHLSNLDQSQIMSLLRNLPNVFTKLAEQGNLKEDAAQTLSNLAQSQPFGNQHMPVHYPQPGTGLPGINDPGPSSHPRGPPNLGQLSAVAMQAATAVPTTQQPPQPLSQPPQQGQPGQVPRPEDGQRDDQQAGGAVGKDAASTSAGNSTGSTGRARGSRSAAMGSDEWSRQRKDNHKEVERRRRGNINEGINELGRIVPNGTGEKAKGAILSRAVQYIHHLKENEARNIEKWTLEKLLMDQAMGDLQAQLEEVKRMWDEERMHRQRVENELEVLRGIQGIQGQTSQTQGQPQQQPQQQNSNQEATQESGTKRRSEEAEAPTAEGEAERTGKRQRTE